MTVRNKKKRILPETAAPALAPAIEITEIRSRRLNFLLGPVGLHEAESVVGRDDDGYVAHHEAQADSLDAIFSSENCSASALAFDPRTSRLASRVDMDTDEWPGGEGNLDKETEPRDGTDRGSSSADKPKENANIKHSLGSYFAHHLRFGSFGSSSAPGRLWGARVESEDPEERELPMLTPPKTPTRAGTPPGSPWNGASASVGTVVVPGPLDGVQHRITTTTELSRQGVVADSVISGD
ncbi:hypothetical protein D1007_03641 [Hordeum vulgare]|nr:hypothetical protein D1007_03641 [Hordeum vulgare]